MTSDVAGADVETATARAIAIVTGDGDGAHDMPAGYWWLGKVCLNRVQGDRRAAAVQMVDEFRRIYGRRPGFELVDWAAVSEALVAAVADANGNS